MKNKYNTFEKFNSSFNPALGNYVKAIAKRLWIFCTPIIEEPKPKFLYSIMNNIGQEISQVEVNGDAADDDDDDDPISRYATLIHVHPQLLRDSGYTAKLI